MKTSAITASIALILCSCTDKQQPYDASGVFEATEIIVSAEANGTIKAFDITEGQLLQAGQTIGHVDSVQLFLQKKQVEAQIGAVLSRKPDINVQIAALQAQLRQAEHEQRRIASMVKADAATSKQLDDANAQVAILKKQIAAQQSALGTTSTSLSREASPLELQIAQLEDQLAKTTIVNPVNGTVLVKYAEPYEMAAIGKALYKIADLSSITLRAYITGDQFAQVKLNQGVTVLVDDAEGKYKTYKGIIEWISDKAEFTPKTIQTRDERANLVYATKIKVENDGYLKIGMYGEVKFD